MSRKVDLSTKLSVTILLLINATLAVFSLLRDSATFDETSHLASGLSYLESGDFRLAPDHPPLAKIWAALPLLFIPHRFPPLTSEEWQNGDYWSIGRKLLFELNPVDQLLRAARLMMVVMLIALNLTVYLVSAHLFGSRAGLAALLLTAFCPTLLAHGRLVTTDLPFALFTLLSLAAWAKALTRRSPLTTAGAALSVGGLLLVKYTAVLLLPVLLLMALASLSIKFNPPPASTRAMVPLSVLVIATLAAAYLSIWTCYGRRYSPFRGEENGRALMIAANRPGEPQPENMDQLWDKVFKDYAGKPIQGVVPAIIQSMRRQKLLPEAYLYGLAYTFKTSKRRGAYLMGHYSSSGWLSYFPVAFAIKTPIPQLLLLLFALMALALGRVSIPPEQRILAGGLTTFALFYFLTAVTSHLNIGHRHLLPLYPIMLIFCGATVEFLKGRAGRGLLAACLGWAVVENVRIYPHYLSYFNQFTGGPERGHLYLADSNIDWGQDLRRLADFSRARPDEPIKLAYFGSAIPTAYNPRWEDLMSRFSFGPPAALTAGTYVISVTQLLGVYEPIVRDSFWAEKRNRYAYKILYQEFSGKNSTEAPAEKQEMQEVFDRMQRGLLLNRLKHTVPDLRIGYSLFLYRLNQATIAALLKPAF